MEKKLGRLHSIETFGTLDGPGIRFVAFLQGCPLQCVYCHNPDALDPSGGYTISAAALCEDIKRYRNFISGVTLSGGEPLLQPAFCEQVIDLVQQMGLNAAIDTAGFVDLARCKPAIAKADLLLLDIKALDDGLCRKITGHPIQRALDVLQFCESIHKPVWIRHVLVPGLTLKEPLLNALADYLTGFSCIARVELLPFHKMGEYKWEKLGRLYTLSDTPAASAEETAWAKKILQAKGLPIPN